MCSILLCGRSLLFARAQHQNATIANMYKHAPVAEHMRASASRERFSSVTSLSTHAPLYADLCECVATVLEVRRSAWRRKFHCIQHTASNWHFSYALLLSSFPLEFAAVGCLIGYLLLIAI